MAQPCLPQASSLGKVKKFVHKKKSKFENMHWANSEKLLLIKGLKQFGIGDLESIAKLVGKSKNEVKCYIDNRTIALGRVFKTDSESDIIKNVKNSPIELWYRHLFYITDNKSKSAEYAPMFAEICGAASNLEPHLVPQNENEPNFASIYNYLKEIFMGHIPPILSPSECLVVLQLLQNLSRVLRKMGIAEEKKFLNSLMPQRDPLLWDNWNDFMENCAVKENLKSSKGKHPKKKQVEQTEIESNDKYPKDLAEILYWYKNVIGSLNPLRIPVSLLESQNKAVKECLYML